MNKKLRIFIWVVGIFLSLIVLGAIFGGEKNKREEAIVSEDSGGWKEVWEKDRPTVAEGWGEPAMLEVNLDDWGDSLWVTPDGKSIYFMWVKGDPLTDIFLGKGYTGGQPSIYVSHSPFETKQIVDKYYFAEKDFGAAGPMQDDNGDWWYMTNRQWKENKKIDTDIHMNYDLLPFNNDEQYVNPHYCVSKDELWFDRDDTEIMVLKNAKAGGFAGVAGLAPEPINDVKPETKESQPWLSSDCNTMYFSSSRDSGTSPHIYMSERIGKDEWSKPVPIVYGTTYGVGEVSLTNDGGEGAKLFYEQIIRNEDETFTTLFFYVEKI
jgi:hypothetical protein